MALHDARIALRYRHACTNKSDINEHLPYLADLARDAQTIIELGTRSGLIDTSHLYEQTVKELSLYRWKVRPGGKIVLHDTELERPYGSTVKFPVKRAVEEFCRDECLTWTNRANNNGLGTIEVT